MNNEPNKLKGKRFKKYYTYLPKVKGSQKQYSSIEKSIFFNFSIAQVSWGCFEKFA